jgi:hypothetical protein
MGQVRLVLFLGKRARLDESIAGNDIGKLAVQLLDGWFGEGMLEANYHPRAYPTVGAEVL